MTHHRWSGNVSVIDTNPGSADFNKVVSTIEVGGEPDVITITPDGSHIYVQVDRRSVVVIDTSNNSVVDTINYGIWGILGGYRPVSHKKQGGRGEPPGLL